MHTDQPTPCATNPRLWDSTNETDHTTARDACLGCDALAACIRFRADQIANEPDFMFFEGTLAGRLHDPRGERRRREKANRLNNIAKANANRPRREPVTHCKRGHEFNEDNTYTTPTGSRTCRVCVRAQRRDWDAKKRAADNAA